MTLIEAAKLARDAFEWNFNTDLDNIPACERWAKMLKENIAALNQAIAKAEQQKPVTWLTRRYVDNFPVDGYETCHPTDYGAIPAFTHPPKREWQGLTDEDVMAIAFNFDLSSLSLVAKAIEAKLKEKNT